MDQCNEREQRRSENLARLTESLKRTALSTEELGFPKAEEQAYAKLRKKERETRLAELEYLLYRKRKEAVAGLFLREVSATQEDERPDRAATRKAMRKLIDSATPCTLSALEGTVLMADFGLPLRTEWAAQGVNGGQILEEVEKEYQRAAEAGKSAEQAYLELRPSSREQIEQIVEPLLERMFAAAQKEGSLGEELRKRLVSDLEEFLHFSAEPLRMEIYLDVLVGDFERYAGMRSTEESLDWLQNRVQRKLFKNLAAMRRLESAPAKETAERLHRVVDEWFKKEGLPEVERRLFEDSFSGFWFYVQTGMVARRPFVFGGSRLKADEDTPELKSLEGLSLQAAQAELIRNKIPNSYVERFLALEQSLTSMQLTREEFLARVAREGAGASEQQSLEKILAEQGTSEMVSSMDLISRFVRDASRFQGAPARSALAAGLRAFREAKEEELARELHALPEEAERSGLQAYLRTAGEWMLELEEREGAEKRFQESTGGGPVGWVLRQTVMGNGLPPELWAPGGVTGDVFARFVDEIVPGNPKAGQDYHAKQTSNLEFLESGEAYHKALVKVVNEANTFLNIQQFDWSTDRGGKEIAYRLMAKKLGLTGEEYDSLVSEFQEGTLGAGSGKNEKFFYDVPTKKMKNLLFYKLFANSTREPMQTLRGELEQVLGGPLECPSVESCGDLSKMYQKAGSRYDPRRKNEPEYSAVWEAYRKFASVFEEREPELKDTRPRRSLAEYIRGRKEVQRFVRRYGLKRQDNPEKPFEINVVTEGKRDSWNLLFKGGKVHGPVLEFDLKYLAWKGVLEYPWHISRAPIPGRKIAGKVPMPYVPWPWLGAAPGFGWAGAPESLGLQHLAGTDVRNGWAMITHTKNISSESAALESGMGFGSKYFNLYPEFRTWHDAGVVTRSALVEDANDQFVLAFNHARVNNRGLPESQGVKIAPLKYADYGYKGNEDPGARAWVLTTDPDSRDYTYRGIFIAALAAARENIYLENAFFTDSLVSRMLIRKAREFRARIDCGGLTELACAAKKRDGVKIYVVLPQSTDQPLIDVVGRAEFYDMINEGVKIYLWNPASGYAAKRMLHTKAWMIDYQPGQSGLTYVGSHNANQRSHWADNEMGFLSSSPAFAQSVYENLFAQDMNQDATVANPASFNIERKIHPVRSLGRFARLTLVDILWFF